MYNNGKIKRPIKDIKTAFNTLRKDLGLPEGLTIHDIRAYAATELGNCLTTFELQQYLGHKDPKTTERYSRTTNKRIKEVLLGEGLREIDLYLDGNIDEIMNELSIDFDSQFTPELVKKVILELKGKNS